MTEKFAFTCNVFLQARFSNEKASKKSFQATIFKVKENSRTFQGLAQKFKDFSRTSPKILCELCKMLWLVENVCDNSTERIVGKKTSKKKNMDYFYIILVIFHHFVILCFKHAHITTLRTAAPQDCLPARFRSDIAQLTF